MYIFNARIPTDIFKSIYFIQLDQDLFLYYKKKIKRTFYLVKFDFYYYKKKISLLSHLFVINKILGQKKKRINEMGV